MNDDCLSESNPLGSQQPHLHRTRKLQWFYNLPIRHKQLLGLFTSEVLSIVGLVGVGACLIVLGGRSMLLEQAKSELAVTQINYNIKIDQMGFGFRGQSDNAAIIAAARTHAENRPLEPELEERVKQILQNEVEARNIEYATLVGKDLRIIVNANTNRTGERFNPNNLVREAIANPQQIKTSEVVSGAELARENPPLPPDFSDEDALIRYTVTPVRNPQTQAVLGALVSGDIVNGKEAMVRRTLSALGGGYSAIYLRQPTGEFVLATSASEPQIAELGVDLGEVLQADKRNLLTAAVAASGQPVTGRLQVHNRTYTIAAQSLSDFAGEPVAVLVRGTPETALNALLGQGFRVQIILAVLALGVDVLLAVLLGNAIAEPIKRLRQTARSFADGNLQARSKVTATDEVGELATTFNQMADRIVSAWQVETMAREQARLNERLHREIAERVQAQAALEQSKVLLEEKNQALKQTLRELRSTQAQMIQAEKMSSLGQMVAGVAHEINNPVNFIYGNLTHAGDYARELLAVIELYQEEYPHPTPKLEELIERSDLEFIQEDFLQLLGSMKVGTDRIREIVKSLRTFSRLDEAEIKAIDLHESIDSTLMILQNRLKIKPVRVVGAQYHCSPIEVIREYDSLPLVECYPGQLNQVFMNLLANAIDALEEAMATQQNLTPKIWIRTQTLNDREVQVAIADNGLGIPESASAKLFDPFFTTKPIGKGTGLGLSISYQIIVDRHGGQLGCESRPGGGTEFILTVPLRQPTSDRPGVESNIDRGQMAIVP